MWYYSLISVGDVVKKSKRGCMANNTWVIKSARMFDQDERIWVNFSLFLALLWAETSIAWQRTRKGKPEEKAKDQYPLSNLDQANVVYKGFIIWPTNVFACFRWKKKKNSRNVFVLVFVSTAFKIDTTVLCFAFTAGRLPEILFLVIKVSHKFWTGKPPFKTRQ